MSSDLQRRYHEFFVRRGHHLIENHSLIPDDPDDPVLFITAGMHPLIPYLQGRPHPSGRRLVNTQRCVRTTDIDQVGDRSHLTFFEMLGNWSLGDYHKTETLGWSLEFLIDELGLPLDKLGVTVFSGRPDCPRDLESRRIWQQLGLPEQRIFDDGGNWWGPSGDTGPCGPDSEIFYWIGNGTPQGHPGQDPGWVEIWNCVFPGYDLDGGGVLHQLPSDNVDTGMGLERVVMILEGRDDIYQTGLFRPLMDEFQDLSQLDLRSRRVVCDHLRSSAMMLTDGVIPSNQGRGYVLRRIFRRMFSQLRRSEDSSLLPKLLETLTETYQDHQLSHQLLEDGYRSEQVRFERMLQGGMRRLRKQLREATLITGEQLSDLQQSHGLPVEFSVEEIRHQGYDLDPEWSEQYRRHQQQHRDRSR